MSPRPATLLAAALAIGATPQNRATLNFSDVAGGRIRAGRSVDE
jgi:hypothetical protein